MSKITENFIRRAWGFAKRGKDILKFPHMVTESNIHVKTVVSFSICYYETDTFFIYLLFQKYNFTLLIYHYHHCYNPHYHYYYHYYCRYHHNRYYHHYHLLCLAMAQFVPEIFLVSVSRRRGREAGRRHKPPPR